MLKAQLQAFLEAVKGDTALQARIQDTSDLDAVVAIAMEAGFVVSKPELEAAQALELSEGELDTISGGLRKAVGGNTRWMDGSSEQYRGFGTSGS
jgi:predicted ribosomally synthesized peptide with nif11-like leader